MPASALLVEALHELADILEARGEYYYEEINVKRWHADAGACELCQENEDLGWIPDDDVFQSVFGDIDDGEAHPHCECVVEYGVKRKRVYV